MFDRHTLKNGLRVVGVRTPHLHSCCLGLFVKVGSANELPQENGLSHFIEHMVFKGTTSRSARQIAEEMDAVGAQMNAFTSKEFTCFYAQVTQEDLALGVDMIADLVTHPLFDATELDKERGVVLEEISMYEDAPANVAMELLAQAQFEGSFARAILGPADQIRSYSRQDMHTYWQNHYVPGNMVLAVCGNYDWDTFCALAEQYLGDFAPTGNSAPQTPNSFISLKLAKAKDIEQVHLCLGYPALSSQDPRRYQQQVLSTILGGGMSSRLFQHIREELGMAYSVFSFSTSYTPLGTFNVYAATNPENVSTVVEAIHQDIKLLLDKGITDKEFSSAKAQRRSAEVFSMESSSDRMVDIGAQLLLTGELKTPEERIALLNAVTPEDVMNIAGTIFSGSLSAAMVGKDVEHLVQLV